MREAGRRLERRYDVSRLTELGFSPTFDISSGSAQTFDWYGQNYPNVRLCLPAADNITNNIAWIFRDNSMILLLGNCQLQRLSFVLNVNGIACTYLANTERLDDAYDPDRILEAVSSASLVIAQPIFNMSNPLNYKDMSKIAKEVIYLPYLYVDGLFSLGSTDIGTSTMLGSEALDPYLEKSFAAMLNDFLMGYIDFNGPARVKSTVTEMERREKEVAAIPISDVVAEKFRDRKLLLSHNHPEKWLFEIQAERLFKAMGKPYRPYESLPHYQRVEYLFNAGESVLSPYDVDQLHLRFESDDQWWIIGHRLLARYWDHHRPDER
jgi:hypothetical protein